MTAVKNGDTETAQRMADEAAQRAGYDRHLYHGAKKGGGFTVFKDWQYFTENKAYAERYMQRDDSESLYDVYVKTERMFDTRRPEIRKSRQKNKFWVHKVEILIKNTNGLPAGAASNSETGYRTDGVDMNSTTNASGSQEMSSLRNPSVPDARTLLSGALMETAQNDVEKKRLTEYQEKIGEMNAQQEKLGELNAEIKELSFARGKRNTARLKSPLRVATEKKTAFRLFLLLWIRFLSD